MTLSPRRLSNIVAKSRPPTQGSGQLDAELYEVARKRCRAVLGAIDPLGTETGAFQAHRVTVPKRRRFRRDALAQ